MRPSLTKKFTDILALTATLCLLGCDAGSSFGGGVGGKKKKATETSQLATAAKQADVTSVIGQLPSDATFEQFSGIVTADFFADIESKASNDPVTIRGYTLLNLADHASDLGPHLQEFIDRFPTMGAFAAEAGVASATDVPTDDVDKGLAILEEATNNGSITDWIADREASIEAAQSAGSDSVVPSLELKLRGMHLRDAGGCALAIAGAVGATIGAGTACAGTGGVACAGAGVGAATSYGWVAHLCPKPPKGTVCLTACTQEQADQVADAMQYALD